MELTPPPLRGNFYPGLLTKRCWAYKTCSVCSLCQNYDKNAATCTFCESRKIRQQSHHCACTEKQRMVVQDMQKRFNRPLTMAQGQEYSPIDQQVPLDQVNEDLYARIAKEFHTDNQVI